MKEQHTGVSTFASRTSPSTMQSLQKSFHLSHPSKIELVKSPFPSENKKYATAQINTTKKMTVKLKCDNGLQSRKTEHQAVTGGIFYCRDSAGYSVSASNKLLCNLTGQCSEIGNKYIPPIR